VGDGLTRHGQSPMRVACLLRNVPCGREKATKRPGVLVRSRPRRGEVFTPLPPRGGPGDSGAAVRS
jgi:hypothetical protein